MKYTQIPTTALQTMQLNAGVLAVDFTPATGELAAADIIAATSGGINATCAPAYVEVEMDNAPKNTMELKKIDTYECKMGGTFVTVDTSVVVLAIGAADVDGTDTTLVKPRMDLTTDDFTDIWFIGDYSDKNGDTNGGYVAVHLSNALSTDGFSMQTADKDKGQFTANFMGHFSTADIDTVPFEVYVKAGTDEA